MDERVMRLMRAAGRLWREAVAYDRLPPEAVDGGVVVFSATNPFAAMHGRVMEKVFGLIGKSKEVSQ